MDDNLSSALEHGFLAAKKGYQSTLSPTLITNIDLNLGDCLNDELATAETFILAVAFITEGGLLMLKTKLADLAVRGIHGKIITSTYLGFNQPKMFGELLKLENVEVWVVDDRAFHTKAYYIKHHDYHTVLIGSGNLTATALKTNLEWTVKLNSRTDGEFTQRYLTAFETLEKDAVRLTSTWLADYTANYEKPTQLSKKPQQNKKITPNTMQKAALIALQNLRATNARRGLVVSATGTGKTYLAAFDVQQVAPKRMLFIAHREQLLTQAQATFKRIFGNSKKMGIFSGRIKDDDAEFIFATIQTLTKHYQDFKASAFDYIVIDETHRAKADTYQILFEYFKPQFLLGITATPDRMDGFNVYELFDYNLAYEISLTDALESEMLVPFNYIGVADYSIEGDLISDVSDLKYLVADERIKHLIAKTKYYGYAGNQLRGIIFVSRIEEGEILAQKLTDAGIPSCFLSAQTSNLRRNEAIKQLVNGELKYLIAVDIFNEGIDIPSINQIVMMRSTQSKIVFLQQLGRGLRKYQDKEYLTVIDFIGNYQNNYLIPQVFEQGVITDKDHLRMQVLQPQLSGLSTINFEAIATQNILNAVTTVKFDHLSTLKIQFGTLLNRYGRIPSLFEVYRSQQIDLRLILSKFKSYPEFVAKMMMQPMPTVEGDFLQWLQFVTQDLVLGKRRHELLVLKALLKNCQLTTLEILAVLDDDFHNATTLASIIQVLGINEYFTAIDRRKYGNKPLVEVVGDNWMLTRKFTTEEVTMMNDAIQTGIELITKENVVNEQLTLYQKYRRKDVVRVLNWQSDLPSIDIGGYRYDEVTQTLPIFVTVQKNGKQATDLSYNNNFLAPNRLPFFSKANRTLSSPVEAALYHADTRQIFVPLFVKKSDDEGAAFYYLGPVQVDQIATKETKLLNERTQKEQPVIRFELVLNTDVPHHLLEYLVQ